MRIEMDGLKAEELRAGTLIGGERVARMTCGRNMAGQGTTSVQFERITKRGKRYLTDPVTYVHGRPVPGTRRPTTWNMPAGPVHRKPGTKQNGGWWGDGDATDRGSRADRHQRRIEALTYAD